MPLSRRESQVVKLIGKGLSRAEISDRLGGLSRKCVSVFIERARGKFGEMTGECSWVTQGATCTGDRLLRAPYTKYCPVFRPALVFRRSKRDLNCG